MDWSIIGLEEATPFRSEMYKPIKISVPENAKSIAVFVRQPSKVHYLHIIFEVHDKTSCCFMSLVILHLELKESFTALKNKIVAKGPLA